MINSTTAACALLTVLDPRLSGLVWTAMLVSLAIVITVPRPAGIRTLIVSIILRFILSVGLEPTLWLLGALNVSKCTQGLEQKKTENFILKWWFCVLICLQRREHVRCFTWALHWNSVKGTWSDAASCPENVFYLSFTLDLYLYRGHEVMLQAVLKMCFTWALHWNSTFKGDMKRCCKLSWTCVLPELYTGTLPLKGIWSDAASCPENVFYLSLKLKLCL